MIYRKLDSNGDYSFGRGGQDFHSGTVAVAQAIKTRLLLFSSEWWEDLEQGLPLFQNILGASGSPESLNGVDLLIQERITGTSGVKSLSNYTRSFDNRELSISCNVTTIYGDAEIDITL
jgi:hypothetical protein